MFKVAKTRFNMQGRVRVVKVKKKENKEKKTGGNVFVGGDIL